MANSSSDFNYKVALASGLKSLQSKRLKQAEEQFRYLMQHFPTAEGGYRGLAKVLVEQEDRAGALKVLVDGGAALAKAGQRDSAIAVYKEAVQLDPRDKTAHRRLASSLALAGDTEGAAHEYVRFIREADAQSAQLEAAYALERMPHNAEIEEAARSAGAAPVAHEEAAHAQATQMSSADRDALMRSAFGTAAPAPSAAPADAWAPQPSQPAQNDAWQTQPAANTAWQQPARHAWQTPAASGADPWAAQPAEAPASPEASNGEPMGADVDDLAVEATAARYLAKGDPRGGTAALEAARRYIAAGRIDAASDLLLQLIAAGISDHDAQRLLLDVTKSLGKKDVAQAKVQLLVQALKLDGRAELAAEVEAQSTEA